MKLDQSQSPDKCEECKRLGKECPACWRRRIHALADGLEMKVVAITAKRPEPPAKELFEEDGA